MYLPQFHIVPENDKWWGKGFTDWVSTKKGRELFEGHYQPHVPLGNNYYNLLEKETMIWQADLMKKYGIDGQCIYHYWFKKGRQILEKPAENLLKWTDIDMPFCFCWANETWARSWSNIRKANSWSDNDEPPKEIGDAGILLEQNYGEEIDWKKHFDYLLPFFTDKRYIKHNEMPIFLIYHSSEIYCLEEMVECFNKLARQNGMPGIYFICAENTRNLPDNVDAVLVSEPQNSMRNFIGERIENKATVVNYEQFWDYLLQYTNEERKTYYGCIVSYDDTPRRGVKGTVINGASPKIFEEKFKKLLAKSEQLGNEYVFVNAWNEWGEGMHLEPDEKWGYGYLKGIKNAKETYVETTFEIGTKNYVSDKYIELIKEQSAKFETYLNTLDQWMELREKDISLIPYFNKNNYKRIAIYGYGIFARHLINELQTSTIDIVGVVDKQKDKIRCEMPVMFPEDKLENIDVLVVTSFYFFKEIQKFYKDRNIKIVSIENIIKEIASNR